MKTVSSTMHSKAFSTILFSLLICTASCFIPNGNLNFVGTSFAVPGNASYDYIVVGGGTAGATLATRLAQNGSYSVALVEAGSFYEMDNGNNSVVPSGATYGTGSSPDDYNPLVDWHFVTEPQAGLNGRQLHYARGKCFGGSSGRNYFLYHFPTKGAHAKWASEVGDSSFEYDSFRKYYQKTVNFSPADNSKRARNASYTYRGSSIRPSEQPLHVTLPNYASAFASYHLKALKVIGVPTASDFVHGRLEGATYAMMTLNPKDMTRSSSESSFLQVALQQTRLAVYQKTLAKRILFSGSNATGVVVETQGLSYSLTAKREVIVSNGAFQSPQLLMVSGVGPSETLSKLNISVVRDLPGVGQNLWDHIFFGTSHRVNVLTHSSIGNPAFAAQANLEYLTNQTGVIGNPGGDTMGWERRPKGQTLSQATQNSLNSFPNDWPAIEYLMLDGYAGDNKNYILGAPRTPFQYASVVAALVAPLSRGNVTINSTSTSDLPLINPNWFTHPADQEVGIAAFRRLRALMDTSIMRNVTIGDELFPGRNVTSDEQILNFIREASVTVYHAAGTCKMGKADDPMAVVDTEARVHGVQGLRVVDASAFPFLPPGHPQSVIYALAEKVAENILGGSQ